MDDRDDRDEKGRFVPGNPGGPGRPKFSLVSIIREKLESVPEGEKRTMAEILLDDYLQAVHAARDGVAIRDIIDRFDGKPKATVRVENDRDAAWIEWLREHVESGAGSEADGDTGGVPEEPPETPDTGGGGAVGQDGAEQPTVLPPGEGEGGAQ